MIYKIYKKEILNKKNKKYFFYKNKQMINYKIK